MVFFDIFRKVRLGKNVYLNLNTIVPDIRRNNCTTVPGIGIL